jgi:hypothetical protein
MTYTQFLFETNTFEYWGIIDKEQIHNLPVSAMTPLTFIRTNQYADGSKDNVNTKARTATD